MTHGTYHRHQHSRAVCDHEAKADPHPQYLLESDNFESVASAPAAFDNIKQAATEYARTQTEAAVAAIQSGEILVAVNVYPHEQFKEWNLEPIPVEEELI